MGFDTIEINLVYNSSLSRQTPMSKEKPGTRTEKNHVHGEEASQTHGEEALSLVFWFMAQGLRRWHNLLTF